MTCNYKRMCKRIITLFVKHDDRANTRVKHLDFENDGYVINIPNLGGESQDLDICLDCGKIQNWTPVSDEDIKNTKEYQRKMDED